jgi:hypothetical protein
MYISDSAANERKISVFQAGGRFHGVATRYLPNYLGWRWAIDQQRIRLSEILLRATEVFRSERVQRLFL